MGNNRCSASLSPVPVTIKEVLALGDKLQKGTIRLKEVIRGFQDQELPDGDDSTHVEKVLKLIDEMKECDATYQGLVVKYVPGPDE